MRKLKLTVLVLGTIVLVLGACASPTAPAWECEQAFVLDTLATAGDTTAWLLAVEECRLTDWSND